MDVKLVGAAVQFHGEDLLHSLTDEQGEPPSSNVTSYLQRWRPSEPEIRDKTFQRDLCSFIARKSDLLFRPLTEEEKNRQRSLEAIDDSFAIMPPLETFMGVPSYARREQLWKSLRVNDCVTCVVSAIIDQGLRLTLLCVDKGICRDIDDLNIPAFCPVKELPKLYAKESALGAFQKRDIVRGLVLSVVEETERIIVSLRTDSVPDEKTYPRIGLITEDDFPVHYRRQSQIQDMCYEEMLQSILGFNNTGNVHSLTKKLQISSEASYFRFFSRLKIPQKEYAEGLKKWQSQKLAHHSVVQGVEMFKKGDYLEAMQHLNRALQVDAENVEALVARGALYANKENFSSAIRDFEEALTLNPKHNNARNYLMETLLTVGRMCEERRDLAQAVRHYESVLKMDDGHTEATELLQGCRQLMAFQTGEMKDEEFSDKGKKSSAVVESSDEEHPRKEKGSSASLLKTSTDKLKALIKEDRERKPRSARKEKRARSRSSSSDRGTKKGKQRKKKKRRRTRSSSSNSSSDSDSRSSDRSSPSGSSSIERSHRSRKKKRGKDKKRSRKSKRSGKDSGSSKRRGRSRAESSEKEDTAALRNPDRPKLLVATGGDESGSRKNNGDKEPHRDKDMSSYEAKNAALEQEKQEELFYHRTAAASFLPVSSFDFFSKSTAIPGLGSPSPPRVPPSSSSVQQEVSKRSTLLRDSPAQGSTSRMVRGFESFPLHRGISLATKQEAGVGRSSPTDAGRKYRNQSETSWDSKKGEVEEFERTVRGREQRTREEGKGAGGLREARDYQGETSQWDFRAQAATEGSPREDHLTMRRDDVLIAQRQKFYEEKKEEANPFRKFRDSRSRSSSSRSSRSRSGSLTRRKSQGGRKSVSPRRSWTHSRSRSPKSSRSPGKKSSEARHGDKSPVITGVKELDRYLGGAKFLIQKAMEAKGYSTWQEFTARGETSGKSNKSRSPSAPSLKKRLSRSPSPKRFKSRSPSPKRYKSTSRSPKSFQSRSRGSRSPVTRGTSARSRSGDPGQAARSEDCKPGLTRWDADSGESKRIFLKGGGHHKSQSPKDRQEEEWTSRKDSPAGHVISSFGKFGPPAKHSAMSEKPFVKEVREKGLQRPEIERDAKGDAPHSDKKGLKGEKSASKADPFSFMPRILRKPKMDGPDVNKPLMSSNQLERNKKALEEQGRTKDAGGSRGSNSDRDPSAQQHDRAGARDSRFESSDENIQNRDVRGNRGAAPDAAKPKKNRWDQEDRSEVKPAQQVGGETKAFDGGQEGKRSLEEEMEREIERRVRERLRQQETSLADPGTKRAGSNSSRSPVDKTRERRRESHRSSSDERDRRQERRKDVEQSSRKKRYNDSDDDDDDDEQHHKRRREESKRKHRGKYEDAESMEKVNQRGRGGWRGRGRWSARGRSRVLREVKKGWCEDTFGNAYFAEVGKVLKVGKNLDNHGNTFYKVRRDFSNSPGESAPKSRRYRSRSRSCSNSKSNSRSSSPSSNKEDSSARKRKRSRSSEKSRPKVSEGADRTVKKGEGNDTATNSGLSVGSAKSGKTQDELRNVATRLTAGTSEGGFGEETHLACGREKLTEKAGGSGLTEEADLEKLTRSRWDTEIKSRWDEGGQRRSRGPGAGKGDSLTDLEKFLLELKQQKKKQWIAEGKVKEK